VISSTKFSRQRSRVILHGIGTVDLPAIDKLGNPGSGIQVL
jgi:hypothetical protein